MSKLNPKVAHSYTNDDNLLPGGMIAAKQSYIASLRRITLANLLWENNAYISGKKTSDLIEELIPKCSPEDVANLAIECREKQKLRHTPIFMIVEMCKLQEHRKLVAEVIYRVCTRPDMITDLVALYWKDGKKPLPNQMKKGLAMAFSRFNEYSFAKYDRDNGVKLRDVLFLVHPKPVKEKEELYRKIANRKLDTPDTWEVGLSKLGNNPDTWTRLIREGKLGGLAMLRNIQNMQKAKVDKSVIDEGLKTLKSSMLLPLDFLKSARMNPAFSREIEEVMFGCYANLPKLPGKTLFIVDVSGSMGSLTSGLSAFSRLDQACAMAMLAVNQCESYELVTTAGCDTARKSSEYHIKYPKKGFDLAKQIETTKDTVGHGGIFTRQCLEWCEKNVGVDFDRIIVFSDSQDCDREKDTKFPKPFGKNNYIVDISANKNGVNYEGIWTAEISGWSEHFLTFIAALEGLENKFEEQ